MTDEKEFKVFDVNDNKDDSIIEDIGKDEPRTTPSIEKDPIETVQFIQPIQPIQPTGGIVKIEEEEEKDYFIEKMNEILKSIERQTHFYYAKGDFEKFLVEFNTNNMDMLSDRFYKEFINKAMKQFFDKIKGESFYHELILKFTTFYINFFSTRIELVDENGWKILHEIFTTEDLYKKRNVYNYEAKRHVDVQSIGIELITELDRCGAFEKINEIVKLYDVKPLIILLSSISSIFQNCKEYDLDKPKEDIACSIYDRLQQIDLKSLPIQLLKTFAIESERFLKSEYVDFAICEALANSLQSFDQRMLFFLNGKRLLDTLSITWIKQIIGDKPSNEGEEPFKTKKEIIDLFTPSLSILNESIQKQILVASLPIYDFLCKNGKKAEIFERCLTIVGSGHISIVEVIFPFFKKIVDEGMDEETFRLVVATLQKVEEKTIGHFELFCELVKKKVSLINDLFELFINGSDIEMQQMAISFSKIVEVTLDDLVFNSMITKMQELMSEGYKQEKCIVFSETVFSLLTGKSESEVLNEKGIKEMFMEVITTSVQKQYSKRERNIIDGALNVLLGMSFIDMELPLMLFGELWEVFMADGIDEQFRSRLFVFFNSFFSKESESKELALIPLDEHVQNEEEIIKFDSPEGVDLIQKIIEEVNKQTLIKKENEYQFRGNLNDIAHLVPLKRLLIVTNNKKTEECAMNLLVSIVKSVPVQTAWKVVVEWIENTNELFAEGPSGALEKEQCINLRVLNSLLRQWTESDAGKAISHVRSLKGKPMMFNVTVRNGDEVLNRSIRVLSSMSIGEVKKIIGKEFKVEVEKATIQIEGIDDFEESTTISDLLLPNDSEIILTIKKEDDNSVFRENEQRLGCCNKKEVKLEDVKTLVEMCGVSKQLAYCALKKYAWYSTCVDMACSAILDNLEEITDEYMKDLEKGEVYNIPDDDGDDAKRDIDLSFIKLVADSNEIITLFGCFKKNFSQQVDEIVWKIMMSLPSFDNIIKKVNLCFGNGNTFGPKPVFDLLTDNSPYTLLYTLQLVDKILFPESDAETSTTTDTIKSKTLLRETIVHSQVIFDQICLAFRTILRRKCKLNVEIIEMFSKIFSFFIHKLCKHQQLLFNIYENQEIFDGCFDVILSEPNNPHVSGVFISIASSVCELISKGSSISIQPDLHNFLIQYFNSQQKYDEEQVTTMSFITTLVQFLKSNPTSLFVHTEKLTKDLFHATEIYGIKKSLYFYFKILCLLLELTKDNTNYLQEIFNFVVQVIETYEPNEQFTDDSDYYIVGLLKVAKLLLNNIETTSEEMYVLVAQIFHNCYGTPLRYKLRGVRNSAYELMNAIFDLYPEIVSMFSTEVFDQFFEYKNIRKLDVVPKTSRTGYRGIRNLGTTCYINATLQQLFMMTEFRENLLRIVSDGKMPVTKQLQKLFISLKGGSQDCYNADSLIEEVQKHKKRNDLKSQQHDACDFLIMLFDCLEDEMNKGCQQQIFPIFTLNMVMETQSLDSSVKEHRETKEEFRLLPLPIQGKRNVEQCLSNLFKPELFKGENRLKTDEGKYFNASKQYKIESLPHYLLLQLNRFDSFDINVMKINDKCEVPLGLDLSKYLKEKGTNGEYKLSGVMIHLGNAGYGHYFSYILVDGKWMEFNDSRVSYISPEIATRNMNGGYKDFGGYLLVYERKEHKGNEIGEGVNEDILKELKIEEEKISNDVMYHDNQCMKMVLKQSSLFDPTITEKFVEYCFSYSFSMLNEGIQNISFVDQIIEMLKNYNNPSMGKMVLEHVMQADVVSSQCLNAPEPIRVRASSLIVTAIKWVAQTDCVELLEENTILFRFYQFLRGLLLFSRDYPKNLKQFFILFDTIASIGPKVCYKLNVMGLLNTFWCYFENTDENTGASVKCLVRDVYPDLKYYVCAMQKVICSSFISDFNDQISPYANTQDRRYIGNGFIPIKQKFFSSDLLMQLVAYNFEASAILLKHLMYNDFEVSLNVMNQFKSWLDSSKECDLVKFYDLYDELLMINDDYTDLRVQCFFSPYSNKQTSSTCGTLPKTMTNGILRKFKDYSPETRMKISFTLRMCKKLPNVKQLLLENVMVLERMLHCLNDYFSGNYFDLKDLVLESNYIAFAKHILNDASEQARKEDEFHCLVELIDLIKERSSMTFDNDLLEKEIEEANKELKKVSVYRPKTIIPTKTVSDGYDYYGGSYGVSTSSLYDEGTD